jgi:hypothetical protein
MYPKLKVVQRAFISDDRADELNPSAHTYSYFMIIPNYSSHAILKEQISIAIKGILYFVLI